MLKTKIINLFDIVEISGYFQDVISDLNIIINNILFTVINPVKKKFKMKKDSKYSKIFWVFWVFHTKYSKYLNILSILSISYKKTQNTQNI